MKERTLSFRSLSPRIMGLITGFLWLSYHADQLSEMFLSVAKKIIAAADKSYMGFYDEDFSVSLPEGEIASVVISSVIGLIVAVGLLKNHPKIVLVGSALSAAEGCFYLTQGFMQEGFSFTLIALNGVCVFSVVMIIASLISFRPFLTKVSFLTVVIINAFFGACIFIACMRPLYGAEDLLEALNIVFSAMDSSGCLSRTLIIGLNLYVLVLVTYEGRDVQETCSGDAVEAYSYITMKKHLALLFFIYPVWLFVWVHRTTKAINEITGDYSKYKPTAETLKTLIPFYSLYWTYRQAERLEEELNGCGAEEKGMGAVAVLMSIYTTSGGVIYLQDKMNEYCIISNKKLRKKAKYDYDENEGIAPEYPVDTTERKPTEIIIDD